jgi:hypothetical protein
MYLQDDTVRPAASADRDALGWIGKAPGAPYFVEEDGRSWTPVGYNDSIAWIDLAPLFRRKDLPRVEAHLRWLQAHGVTCIRLMLECAQSRHRYFERPFGRFNPAMVQLWDDLFALCERTGLRVLLTPFDTFWTWMRWAQHPYNQANGGPLLHPSRFLLEPEVTRGLKARLSFAVERWAGSGALFAWDLWNEIHPAQAEDTVDCWGEFIHELSDHVRSLERRLYGRTHLQTVSLFGPELKWRPELAMAEPIFRHPDLDFATIHIYAEGTIDDPRNTVDPARDFGAIVRRCLGETDPDRPFLDTEHGPIHTFKDRRRTLPEAFDDEMFRHMQWAHLAAGGAGGGMRWPNRKVHVLTPGMRRAQKAMADFLPEVEWPTFRRRNLNAEVVTAPGPSHLAVFASGDMRQALVYLLRRDVVGADGRLRADAAPLRPVVRVPGLAGGTYRVSAWSTTTGRPVATLSAEVSGEALVFESPPVAGDMMLAVRPA